MLKNFFVRLRTIYLYPIIGFIIVLGLFLLVAIYLNNSLLDQTTLKFENKSNEVTESVSSNFSVYTNFLEDVKGFFASSENVTREEFTTFIQNVNFLNRYSGITSVGFSKKITREEKQNFEDSLNNDIFINPNGGQKYKITPESDKDTYFVSDYVDPYDINLSVLGFDLSSSPERFSVVTKAIETGQDEMTQRIALLGKYTGEYGFTIYIPIYKNGSPHSNKEERLANIVGVVSGTFRLNNVFSQIFQDQTLFQNFNLKIYTDGQVSEDFQLFNSQAEVNSNNKLTSTHDKEIAGRPWNLIFTTSTEYGLSQTESNSSRAVIVFGIILAALTAILLYYLRNSQSRAIEISNNIKIKLEQSDANLKNIIDGVDITIFSFDKNGIITVAEGKGLADLNLSSQKLVGTSILDFYKDSPGDIERVKKALSGESITAKSKIGSVVLEVRLKPILDRNGEVTSVAGMSQNITEREESVAKLLSKTDELERMNKIMIDRELKMKELKEQLAQK